MLLLTTNQAKVVQVTHLTYFPWYKMSVTCCGAQLFQEEWRSLPVRLTYAQHNRKWRLILITHDRHVNKRLGNFLVRSKQQTKRWTSVSCFCFQWRVQEQNRGKKFSKTSLIICYDSTASSCLVPSLWNEKDSVKNMTKISSKEKEKLVWLCILWYLLYWKSFSNERSLFSQNNSIRRTKSNHARFLSTLALECCTSPDCFYPLWFQDWHDPNTDWILLIPEAKLGTNIDVCDVHDPCRLVCMLNVEYVKLTVWFRRCQTLLGVQSPLIKIKSKIVGSNSSR